MSGESFNRVPNSQYRCYFTDENDRIKAVEQLECEDDAAAFLKAEQVLAASAHKTAELWQGSRLVGKWGNTGELALRSGQSEQSSESASIFLGGASAK